MHPYRVTFSIFSKTESTYRRVTSIVDAENVDHARRLAKPAALATLRDFEVIAASETQRAD